MSIIDNAIRPGIKMIQDNKVFFHGKYPLKRNVFISSSKSISPIMRDSLYLAALESVKNGFDIVAIISHQRDDPIFKAVEDSDGVIHAVLPFGFDRISKKLLSKIIINGGSVISLCENGPFSIDLLNRSKLIAASIADIILIGEDKIYKQTMDGYINYSIDEGKTVAILKSALASRDLRSLVYEGCPSVYSMTELLEFPKAIAYPSCKGRYGQGGVCFDIMKLEGDYV